MLSQNVEIADNLPNLRKVKDHTLLATLETFILNRFSNYNKLINVVSYIIRFYDVSRRMNLNYTAIALFSEECTRTLNLLIKISEYSSFARDLDRIVRAKSPKKGSNLSTLNLLINKDIFRIGGRLKNANLPYTKRYPIILSAECNLTLLIIEHIRVFLFLKFILVYRRH